MFIIFDLEISLLRIYFEDVREACLKIYVLLFIMESAGTERTDNQHITSERVGRGGSVQQSTDKAVVPSFATSLVLVTPGLTAVRNIKWEIPEINNLNSELHDVLSNVMKSHSIPLCPT